YTRAFVTGGSPGLGNVTLPKDSSHQFSAAGRSWQLDPTGSVSWPAGNGFWTSSNAGVATVNASGLVTAVGYGVATIRYRPTTPASNYLLTHSFMTEGIAATVTVPAPPPAPLVIDSITVNTALPIMVAGGYQLTAHLAPGDDAGVTWQFMVIY